MTSPCVSYRSDNAINRNPCFLCLLFRLFSGAESAGAVRSLPSPREFCFLVFIIVFVVFTLHGGIALTLHSYLHGGIGLLKIIKMGFEVIYSFLLHILNCRPTALWLSIQMRKRLL